MGQRHDQVPDVPRDALLLWGRGISQFAGMVAPMGDVFLPNPAALCGCRGANAASVARWNPGLVVLIGAGDLVRMTSLVCLPIFGVGALMAARRDVLQEWARKVERGGWAGLLAGSIVLLCSRWMFPQLPVARAQLAAHY